MAYEWLIENYNDGDEIFIFGFSRGAFTARSLAGLVAIDGILRAGSPIGVTELFERYRKGDEESIWTLKEKEAAGDTSKLTEQERWLLKYSQPTKVKVVGVWDTVGAHANVGGGYETDLLAQSPLRWMMKKAESQGLWFRSEVERDGDAVTAPG